MVSSQIPRHLNHPNNQWVPFKSCYQYLNSSIHSLNTLKSNTKAMGYSQQSIFVHPKHKREKGLYLTFSGQQGMD